jgi:hypothetical protein
MKQEDHYPKFDLFQKEIDGFINNGSYDLVLDRFFNEMLRKPDNLKVATFFLNVSKYPELEPYWKPKYNNHSKKFVGGFGDLFDFVKLNKNKLD